ncbi:tetratricopeptide repeat protein [Geobacter sp.]|uniref:tetratricopeptide repeat protein n=1 Tax=Geobacter sp. TaxID=46610 RepID=UPI002634699D|nr:tetratricopeptide repeat protein [Geobacter sp.]
MTKKEKHLDSAQKFLVKGQLDRAIREYEQAVVLDPKDIRVRQKFAELLMRANRKDDAVREFEVIGKFYADNGFYLKAIAVYKQIQRTDPRNSAISLTLASLNEKQGLVGNALAEYKTVYDHYEKSGQLDEALSVLEKMHAVDKDNFNIRLKLAETRHRAGLGEQAYDDFTALARDIKRSGDETTFARVCERIGQLFPERKEFLLAVAEGQVNSGNPVAVLPLLKQLVSDDRFNPRALYLLADAARAANDPRTAKGAYGQIVKRYPDEIAARTGLISCFIDEQNVDEALRYLKMFEPELLSREPAAVEGFYRAIHDLAPQHPDVVDRDREQDKTADVEEKEAASAETASTEPASSPETSPTPSESVPDSGQISSEAATADDFPTEDEIDITFEEEELPETGLLAASADESSGSEAAEPPEPGPLTSEGEEGLFPGDDASATFDFAVSEPEGEFAGGGDTFDGDMVELDVSHLAAESDDWLNGAEETFPASAEQGGAEALDLDFSEDELDGLIPAAATAQEPAKRDKYALDGLFSAFKKGVGEQLDQGDTETHYNLGIAYKEMGLYDDAIAEFRAASLDPQRRIDCITLQGICCREKGDYLQAEELFTGGLALPGLAEEEQLCLKYERALLREAMGACEQALQEYREIYAVSPDFRDTVQKIARLQCDDEALDLADIELVDLDDAEEIVG